MHSLNRFDYSGPILNLIWEWSLLISGIGNEEVCQRYKNLWLQFTRLCQVLLAYYQATKLSAKDH